VAPCPPHHWLIENQPHLEVLTMRCVRCDAVREQPRDPEPAWRNRGAGRPKGGVPPPSFG
jgi:hypothetical protein